MKKTLIIAALLTAGVAVAGTSKTIAPRLETELILIQEKVKINPEDLPDPVKTAISLDVTISNLPILEAWKMPVSEDTVHFAVTFDTGAEEKLTKKYDAEGNEIKA